MAVEVKSNGSLSINSLKRVADALKPTNPNVNGQTAESSLFDVKAATKARNAVVQFGTGSDSAGVLYRIKTVLAVVIDFLLGASVLPCETNVSIADNRAKRREKALDATFQELARLIEDENGVAKSTTVNYSNGKSIHYTIKEKESCDGALFMENGFEMDSSSGHDIEMDSSHQSQHSFTVYCQAIDRNGKLKGEELSLFQFDSFQRQKVATALRGTTILARSTHSAASVTATFGTERDSGNVSSKTIVERRILEEESQGRVVEQFQQSPEIHPIQRIVKSIQDVRALDGLVSRVKMDFDSGFLKPEIYNEIMIMVDQNKIRLTELAQGNVIPLTEIDHDEAGTVSPLDDEADTVSPLDDEADTVSPLDDEAGTVSPGRGSSTSEIAGDDKHILIDKWRMESSLPLDEEY